MSYLERFIAFSMLCEESGKDLQRIKSAYMSTLGLHGSGAILLAVLCRHKEGLSAAELSRACKLDRAAVSRALPCMLEAGVVAYAEQQKKRNYRSRLILTAKGEETVKKMNAFTVDTVRRTSDDISSEDLSTFYRVFRAIERRLSCHAAELEKSIEKEKKP